MRNFAPWITVQNNYFIYKNVHKTTNQFSMSMNNKYIW